MSKIQGLKKIGQFTIVRIYEVDANGQETHLGYGVLSSDGSLLKGALGQTIFGSIEDAINLAEKEIKKTMPVEKKSGPHVQRGPGFSR